MNYLLQGMESTSKINCLLSLTKIDSERKINGLHNHFVKGLGVSSAAAFADIAQPKLTEAIKVLNKVALACEAFHEIKLREQYTS